MQRWNVGAHPPLPSRALRGATSPRNATRTGEGEGEGEGEGGRGGGKGRGEKRGDNERGDKKMLLCALGGVGGAENGKTG